MSGVKSDIQIAREAKMQPIKDILAKINVPDESSAFSPMGRHIAKIRGVLAGLGLSDNARYIERATMAEQRIVNLADVGDGDAPYFSMVLVHKRAEAWK